MRVRSWGESEVAENGGGIEAGRMGGSRGCMRNRKEKLWEGVGSGRD